MQLLCRRWSLRKHVARPRVLSRGVPLIPHELGRHYATATVPRTDRVDAFPCKFENASSDAGASFEFGNRVLVGLHLFPYEKWSRRPKTTYEHLSFRTMNPHRFPSVLYALRWLRPEVRANVPGNLLVCRVCCHHSCFRKAAGRGGWGRSLSLEAIFCWWMAGGSKIGVGGIVFRHGMAWPWSEDGVSRIFCATRALGRAHPTDAFCSPYAHAWFWVSQAEYTPSTSGPCCSFRQDHEPLTVPACCRLFTFRRWKT